VIQDELVILSVAHVNATWIKARRCSSLLAHESKSTLRTEHSIGWLLVMLEVALRLRDELDWNFSPISHNSGLLTCYYEFLTTDPEARVRFPALSEKK
jgi:hypothetical protein